MTKLAVAAAAIACLAASGVAQAHEELKKEFTQEGEASYYGPGFHGKPTATGERFDQNDMTAAHRSLPLGTEATVTNLENGKQIEVEINDRGPYAKGRVLDLSKGAAERLDMVEEGTAPVKIEATPEQQDGKFGREDKDKPEDVAER